MKCFRPRAPIFYHHIERQIENPARLRLVRPDDGSAPHHNLGVRENLSLTDQGARLFPKGVLPQDIAVKEDCGMMSAYAHLVSVD